jgi:hypothetical protein
MNTEPFSMKIPPQLVENYLQRRVIELESLENACKSSDFALVFKVGHQLKGNGLTFGFAEISEFGSKLESSALIQNRSDIEHHLHHYRILLESILKNKQ